MGSDQQVRVRTLSESAVVVSDAIAGLEVFVQFAHESGASELVDEGLDQLSNALRLRREIEGFRSMSLTEAVAAHAKEKERGAI